MNKEMVSTLVDEIESNIAFEVNIKSLAKKCQVSPWHFQRMFKALVGDSLGNYVRGRRLSLASKKLLETDLTIIQIAFDVGFNSNEALSRSFKNFFGYTPKEFRQLKPKVMLKNKPVLNTQILKHVTEDINIEPSVVVRAPILLVGVMVEVPSPFASDENICETVESSWQTLLQREKEIPNRVQKEYYSLQISPSGNYTEETVHHLAAVKVDSFIDIPEGMNTYTLLEQKVAVFDTMTHIDEAMTRRTIDFIYGYWFASSEYRRGEGDDYELFEEVEDFYTQKFRSKYVVPVV